MRALPHGAQRGGAGGIRETRGRHHNSREADAALAADGQTPAGDPNRAYQEGLKDALEGANKNLTFVQAGPESCPAPF